MEKYLPSDFKKVRRKDVRKIIEFSGSRRMEDMLLFVGE